MLIDKQDGDCQNKDRLVLANLHVHCAKVFLDIAHLYLQLWFERRDGEEVVDKFVAGQEFSNCPH